MPTPGRGFFILTATQTWFVALGLGPGASTASSVPFLFFLVLIRVFFAALLLAALLLAAPLFAALLKIKILRC